MSCWTRKESYGKARGWGIHYPLDSVELCLDLGCDRLEVASAEAPRSRWSVRQIYPDDDFVGAVVHPAEYGDPRFCYFNASPSQLIEDRA